MTSSWLVHLRTTSSRLGQNGFTTCKQLSHNLFRTSSFENSFKTFFFNNLFTTCSELPHYLFMTCSWLVHNLSQFFHNLLMTCSGPVHLSTISSWLVHNLYKTCSRLIHNLFITCSQLVHILFKTFTQHVHNFYQNSLKSCSWPGSDFMTFSWLAHLISYFYIVLAKQASWPELGTAQPQLVICFEFYVLYIMYYIFILG